jgi:hypothetical protein
MQRDPLAILLAVGVAVYVAVVADSLARDEFGLSSREVCVAALIGAALLAASLAAYSLLRRASKAN